MSKTIDFSKNASGVMAIAVNGGNARTLYNPNNLLTKPQTRSVIIKLSDETWRQEVSLDDTVTEAGVAKSPFANVAALSTYLNTFFHN